MLPANTPSWLTVRDLAHMLQVKASTLYAWAAAGKIPCWKIHGLLRFKTEEIEMWLASFRKASVHPPPGRTKTAAFDLEAMIARAKEHAYNRRHGETRPTSSLIGKEE